MANTLEDRRRIQKDPGELESWARDKKMKVNADKSKVLYHQKYKYRIWDNCLGSSSLLRRMVDYRLNMSQQYDAAAKKGEYSFCLYQQELMQKDMGGDSTKLLSTD